jgi:hypothetical protein
MTPRHHHPRKARQRRSLTTSGCLKPYCWQFSKEEVAIALNMPVERIVKVYPRPHQIIVVFLNEKGHKCSSFFSYRLFARWQREAIGAIASCRSEETLDPLAAIIQYELEHFPYPLDMADAIWDALLDQISLVVKLSQKCA